MLIVIRWMFDDRARFLCIFFVFAGAHKFSMMNAEFSFCFLIAIGWKWAFSVTKRPLFCLLKCFAAISSLYMKILRKFQRKVRFKGSDNVKEDRLVNKSILCAFSDALKLNKTLNLSP